MAYKYDIFISYKRGLIGDEWLDTRFIPLFQDAVEDEIIVQCGRRALGIFFDRARLARDTRQLDQTGIEPGQNWREALKDGLESSCCLLAVCSPKYFQSEWCMTEWDTFQQRNKAAKKDLIVPITLHDGEKFPGAGSALQYADFNDYYIVGDGFTKTEPYVQFQKLIKVLATRVAKVIASAPGHGGWKVSAGGNVQSEPHIGAPKL
jgi:hypothetical protein